MWGAPPHDDKDLIYEGIATVALSMNFDVASDIYDDKDLIYEGIATSRDHPFLGRSQYGDDKDLIYEGIATFIDVSVMILS